MIKESPQLSFEYFLRIEVIWFLYEIVNLITIALQIYFFHKSEIDEYIRKVYLEKQ